MDKEHQGICQICLRIDKLVHKTRNHNLTQFYNEICKNASDIDLSSPSPQCCVECEQRLRKMYIFKEQCISATNILDNWRKMKSGPKQPLHSIHKCLSKSSLEIWTPDKNAVFCYQHASNSTINLGELRKNMAGPKVQQSGPVISRPKVQLNKNITTSRPEDQLNKNIIISRPADRLNKNIIISIPKAQQSVNTSRPIHLNKTIKPEIQLTKTIIISRPEDQLSKCIPKSEAVQCLYIPIEGLTIPRTLSTSDLNVTEAKPTPITSSTKVPAMCLQDMFGLKSVKKEEDHIKNEPMNDCEDSDLTHSENNSLHEEYLEESSIKSDYDEDNTFQSEPLNKDGENSMKSDNDDLNNTFQSELQNQDVEYLAESDNDDLNNTFKSELQNRDVENSMEGDNDNLNNTFQPELQNRDVEYAVECDNDNLNITFKSELQYKDVENSMESNNDDLNNTFQYELQNRDVENSMEGDNDNLNNTFQPELQNRDAEYVVECDNDNLNITFKSELQHKDVDNSMESNNDDLNNTFQSELQSRYIENSMESNTDDLNNTFQSELQNRDVENSMECNNDDLNNTFQCELQNSDVADDYSIKSDDSNHTYKDNNDDTNKTFHEHEILFENEYFEVTEQVDSPQKRSLAELANISLSGNDFTDDDSKDESLIPKKIRRKRSDGNDRTVSKWNSGIRILNKEFFCKERLKECLVTIFEGCGEIKNGDVTIDKEFILSLLDGKMSHKKMNALWDSIYGRDTIDLQAFSILKNIQNSYQNAEYEYVFDILHLTTEEEMLEEFQNRKTYKCYTDAEFKCDICYRGFQFQDLLTQHEKCHEITSGKIVCKICNKRFHQITSLKSHRVIHTTVYKCKLCPLVTNYRSTMVNHYGQHMGYKHKCDVCDATFRKSSSFKKHKGKCHSTQHICTRCGQAFLTELDLEAHNAKLHPNKDPLGPEEAKEKCPHCELWFLTNEAVTKHIGISHKETAALEPGRVRQRRSRTTPDDNTSKDVPKSPIKCRACNAVGRDRKWLNSHFLSDHPLLDVQALYADVRKHLCHICGKGYCYKYAMLNHMAKHTATRQSSYECSECSKCFANKALLRVHLLTHRPPQKKCNICGKKFVSDANLVSHKRIHIGDRRYKCHHCGKGFLHPGAVREHIKGVHQKIRRKYQKRSPNKVVTEALEYPDVGCEVIWEEASTEYLEVA